MSTISPSEFRELLGALASGVTVVTAVDRSGRIAGMTATAVSAVSLEPPLIMVCVNHKDPLHVCLENATAFAVNILASEQTELSNTFAGDVEHRFAEAQYETSPEGLPLLCDALAHVICEPWKAHPAGDHTIFLGLVASGRTQMGSPLLHFRGEYKTAKDL
jgi:flavin reductase (DIM6/NTAB) family NADH-FMN oxidoreductase RutF